MIILLLIDHENNDIWFMAFFLLYGSKIIFMKRSLAALALSLFLFSCKKDIKELPAPNETGTNTFGAKVNGEMWIPQKFGPINASNLLETRLLGNNLFITAQNFASSPNESEFDIRVIGVTGTGVYPLNSNVSHPSSSYSYAYYVKRRLTPLYEWITSSVNTGSVSISRFDTAARIVSGTFSFSGGEITNAAPVLNVTEGRFDLKY
jgi:hypothetical protein